MGWACLVAAGSSYAATINFNASITDGTVLKGASGSNLNGQVRFGVFWDQNIATPSFLNEAAVGSIWSTNSASQRFSALQSSFLSLTSSAIPVTNGYFTFSGTADNEYDTGTVDANDNPIMVGMTDAPIFAFVVDSFSSPSALAVLSAVFSTVGDENDFKFGLTQWGLTFNSRLEEFDGIIDVIEPTARTVIGTTAGSPISSIQLETLSVEPSGTGAAAITATGTLASLSTTYGTPSSVQTISISGTGLTANITATAPTGVEVSSDGIAYGSTANFLQSGGSVSGSLRVRLAATAPVSGSYDSQNIVLSSTGAASVNLTTAANGNSVAAKALNISGLSAANKDFDGTTAATVSGTPTFVGLANGEVYSVSDSVAWAFPDATVANNKTLSRTGSYSAPSGNYSVTQPILTASIRALPTLRILTIGTPAFASGNTTVTHTFAGNANATYQFEFKSSLTETWQTHPALVNAGSNFSVTFTNTGVNSITEWKNKMFFRVKNS
jgi:predicted heme/steroid binding protein